MNRSAIFLIFLTCLIAVLYLAGLLASFGFLNLDLPFLQLALAPIVLLIVLQVSIKGLRVPRRVVILCGVLVLASFLSSRLFLGPSDHYVLIGRFQDDPSDAKTRIFREKLNEIIAEAGGVTADPLYSRMGNLAEARSFMERHRSVSILLWGSKRWLNATFHRQPEFELSARNSSAAFLTYYGLKLSAGGDWVGLSYSPEYATLQFLGRFISGFVPLGQYAARPSPPRKQLLLTAGRNADLWMGEWHRAEALFIAGNYEFVELLQMPTYNPDRMQEVVRIYSQALKLVRIEQNGELSAALNNNLAIAAYIQSQITGDKRKRKWALKLFKVVLSFGRDKGIRDSYGPQWSLVKSNIDWIHKYSEKKKQSIKGAKPKRRNHGQRRHNKSPTPLRPQ